MRTLYLLLLSATLSYSAPQAHTVEVEIPASQFPSFLNSNRLAGKVTCVMFHVAWCGTCKRTLPEFNKVAASIDLSSVAMASVDVTDESAFSKAMDIKAFPSIRVWPAGQGEYIDIPYYSRDAERMTNFLMRVVEPAYTRVETKTELEERVLKPKNGLYQSILVVGNVLNESASWFEEIKHKFQVLHYTGDVADVQDVFDSDCFQPLNWCGVIVPSPSVLMQGSPVVRSEIFRSSSDAAAFRSWVTSQGTPGIWTITDSLFHLFNDQNVVKVIIPQNPYNPNAAETNATIVSAISPCMAALIGKASFGVINGVSFGSAMSDFGIHQSDPVMQEALVLSDKPLDYSRFIVVDDIASICDRIPAIVRGDVRFRVRGGWMAELVYWFNSSLAMVGLDSDFAKSTFVIAAICVVGMLIALILNWATRETAATASATTSAKKNE